MTHIVGRFGDHGAARSGVRFAAVPLTPRQRALIPYVMWVFIAALIVIAAVQERWASAVVFALFLVTGIIAFHAAPPVPRWITEHPATVTLLAMAAGVGAGIVTTHA